MNDHGPEDWIARGMRIVNERAQAFADYDVLAEAEKVAARAENVQTMLNRCLICHDSVLTVEDRNAVCRACRLEKRA